MKRKLLTQVFPSLIPIRIKQKIIFKYIKNLIKGYKFSSTFNSTKLKFRIKKHKSLLIRKLGDTDLELQYNKVTNLKIAANKINNILIKPNETFSFWHLVGKTSEKEGYKEGIALINGEAVRGVGGGICQLGNLLYWMFLHTPLITVERHRHTFDPFPDYGRVIPFGTGATLYSILLDLKMYNPTDVTFQIQVYFDDEYIRGEILCDKYPPYSYHIYEKDHRFVKKDNEIYRQNKIYQKIVNRKTGEIINENLIINNDCLVKYEIDI